MIVIVLQNCPVGLKNDLTKWFFEIGTGVYCGNVSAKIRDLIWERIRKYCKNGSAVMAFSAANEQGMSVYVHNIDMDVVDHDGIWLMRRPKIDKERTHVNSGTSVHTVSKRPFAPNRLHLKKEYCLVDIETTGLTIGVDKIIEIGMLKVSNGKIIDQLSVMMNDVVVSDEIQKLTGITTKMLRENGIDRKTALDKAYGFLEMNQFVAYNCEFDRAFFKYEAQQYLGRRYSSKSSYDIMKLIEECENRHYFATRDLKLKTVGEYFSIDCSKMHRALEDCMIEYSLLLKVLDFVKEMQKKVNK